MQLTLNQCQALDDALTTVIEGELPTELSIEGVPFLLVRVFRTDYGEERLGVYRSHFDQEAFVFVTETE